MLVNEPVLNTYFRPIGNDFLDKCNRGAFWLTIEGLLEDFPDTQKFDKFNSDELIAYCETKNIDFDNDVNIYR